MSEPLRDIIHIAPARPTGRQIMAEIAQLYDLTVADFIGPARHWRVAHPRQHAMWAIRQRTSLSLPQIGKLMGGRNHATILHGVRQHEARRQKAKLELEIAA